jgi:ubiquinone/menaquinone biosynthesis C-methylase UbiE
MSKIILALMRISTQSIVPTTPAELYSFLYSRIPDNKAAWDCGTGNGQVARVLAARFENVYATDISGEQIKQAAPSPNIEYSVQRSEQTSFADSTFDLVTVAQAIHWFDFNSFYKEVKRTLKNQGIFAVMGYGLVSAGDDADELIGPLLSNHAWNLLGQGTKVYR